MTRAAEQVSAEVIQKRMWAEPGICRLAKDYELLPKARTCNYLAMMRTMLRRLACNSS